MNTDNTKPEILKAATSLLPLVTGGIVGISAIAYYVGWRYCDGYYKELGSQWWVTLLSSAKLLYLSGELIVICCLGIFFSLHVLARHIKRLRIALHGIFILAGLALIFASINPKSLLSPKVISEVSTGAGVIMTFGAGMIFGKTYAHLKDESQWQSSHTFLLYVAIYYGIHTAPFLVGAARARHHKQPQSNYFPVVQIQNSLPNNSWRLVDVASDVAILIKLGNDSQPTQFKIMKSTEIVAILEARIDGSASMKAE